MASGSGDSIQSAPLVPFGDLMRLSGIRIGWEKTCVSPGLMDMPCSARSVALLILLAWFCLCSFAFRFNFVSKVILLNESSGEYFYIYINYKMMHFIISVCSLICLCLYSFTFGLVVNKKVLFKPEFVDINHHSHNFRKKYHK